MSIEERVERIKEEQVRAREQRDQLKKEKEAEFTTHARFVNTRLEQLRELKVVGIIEEFTKSSVSPIFIREDYIKEELTLEPIPGPVRLPSTEQFRRSFHEGYRPRDFWSAHVLTPALDNNTLEWDTNLRIKIEHWSNMTPGIKSQPALHGWVDLVWEYKPDVLSISGENETYRAAIFGFGSPNGLPLPQSLLEAVEEAIAKAVVDPKTEPPRMRYFDSNTPIGAQA